MELVDVKKGWAVVRLPFDKKLTHPYGIAHGGAIFSAADSAVAMALFGMVDGGKALVTVEMKINYLKPFADGEIVAEAEIVSKGSTIVLGEAGVRNGEGELLAKAMATYMLIENRNAGR
jgi:acyl-CoA thioesterase